AGQRLLSPPSIAGLPARSARVGVGPPFDVVRGPSFGSALRFAPHEPSPSRLAIDMSTATKQSPCRLPNTIELTSVTAAPLSLVIPWSVLEAIVLLTIVVGPSATMPVSPLSLIVPFSIDSEPDTSTSTETPLFAATV